MEDAQDADTAEDADDAEDIDDAEDANAQHLHDNAYGDPVNSAESEHAESVHASDVDSDA